MMLKVAMAVGLAGILFTTGSIPALRAGDSPIPVRSPTDRAAIQKAMEGEPVFLKEVQGKKVVPSTVVEYTEAPEGSKQEERFVRALFYRYDDGKSIRALLNRTTGKLVKVEVLEAYPTPPNEAEEAKAKALAIAQIEDVKALLEKYKEEGVTIEFQAPVISDRKDPRFGKRLVTVYLTPKAANAGAISVTVNLTDGTASRN
jgi:hypothetical protein